MNIEKLTIGNTLQVEIHQPYEKMTCYWQRVNFLAYLQGIFYYTVGNKKRIHKSKELKPIKLNKALNSPATSYDIKQDCKNIINSNKITLDKLINQSYNKLTILFNE